MNNNTVELLGYYGSDEVMALSAWTSTSRELTDDKIQRVPKLLKMLASEGHHTPFEKSSLHFLVNVDQATHIHLLKHRVGVSINGECLTGDSLITFVNASGSLTKLSIQNLYDKWNNGRSHQNTEKDKLYTRQRISNRKIRVLNEDTGFFEFGKIQDVMQSGIKQIYKITTECANVIRCSGDHRIFTDNGWNTINNGLSTKDFIGLNGVSVAGTGEYRDKTILKKCRNSNMSIQEMATLFNCSYHTVKKWLKIYNLGFSKEETFFKKGQTPWNKGKKGYKLSFTNQGYLKKLEIASNQPKGINSRLWKGGITKERGLIGKFTRSVAKQVHEKYNFTCQECGLGGKLHCHHIIPVVVDITKAYDVDNLITVCQNCHNNIHKSAELEIQFANKVTGLDFTSKIKEFGKNTKNRTGNKLKVHYSKIVKIEKEGLEMCYDLEINHKYHNFVANGIVVHNSARYKALKEDKMYLPEDWNGNNVDFTNFNAYDDLTFKGIETWKQLLESYTEMGNRMYHECLNQLTPTLGRKRAKESARFFKTMNSQITMDVMFNWRSFAHFQKLRNSKDSQKEVREIAEQMLELVKNIEGNPFKHTIAAFSL
jgi:thymidylate synthase (FAD)